MNVNARKQKLITEINITPLTDIALTLLIIFMITTPLIVHSGIKVNLPNAASAKPNENARQQVNITVTNEGTIYVDDILVTRKEFKERIHALREGNPGIEVVLFSDKLVRFKDIVAVLDTLNGLGIRKLNIAAKAE
ncbi:MAG: biopolymer transporter ExbD [Candidatus Omnitrophota bacterium]